MPKGICFVETKSLDGETNLKHKKATKEVLDLAPDLETCVKNMDGARIKCETPNALLYKFDGNLILKDGEMVPMGPDEILLRGSSLRNTEWVYGVALFTGHDTKIMMNSTKSKPKKSKIEVSTNNYIIVIMLIQVIICCFASVWATTWGNWEIGSHWYLDLDDEFRKHYAI